MATIKSFTDLNQSRRLAEFLPLESADMFYRNNGIDVKLMWEHNAQKVKSPCWSLSALLSVIRETMGYTLYGVNNIYMSCNLGDKPWTLETEVYDNEVDACYEMILKLHELNLL